MSWSKRIQAGVVPRERVAVGPAVSPSEHLREVVAAGTVDAVLAEARAAADAIRREAEERRAAVFDEARRAGEAAGREAGYREGFAEGYAEGLRKAADQAAAALRDFEDERARWRKDAFRHMADVAVAAAERLYRGQLTVDPEHIARVVHECLERSAPQAARVIAVHPLDVAVVLEALRTWRDVEPGVDGVRVVPAADLERGACRVLTDAGWLERDWPGALEALRSRLIAMVAEVAP
jgi:flagellar assembly protein FliH